MIYTIILQEEKVWENLHELGKDVLDGSQNNTIENVDKLEFTKIKKKIKVIKRSEESKKQKQKQTNKKNPNPQTNPWVKSFSQFYFDFFSAFKSSLIWKK